MNFTLCTMRLITFIISNTCRIRIPTSPDIATEAVGVVSSAIEIPFGSIPDHHTNNLVVVTVIPFISQYQLLVISASHYKMR
jgi:hypothetical protein